MRSPPELRRYGTLRSRLTAVLAAALCAAAAVTALALAAVQSRALERQLDASLRAHAASEVLTAIDRADRRAHLHDAPVAVGDGGAALAKYAALYDARGGVLARTATLARAVPARASLPRAGGAFDLTVRGARLRGVLVPMGAETEARALLLAVPRDALDAAQRALVRVALALLALASLLAAALSAGLARWLTRDLEAIAAAARAVAGGALEARAGPVGGVREVRALAQDLDEMIARLGALVATQRRFISDAAHELRTPLTSLRGELELALRRPRSAAEYEVALQRSLADVLALGALTDDLLTLARARTKGADLPRASTASAARRAADAVGRIAEARGVRVAVRGGDAAVRIAPRDLERVVRNLLENAVRHAPDGGEVVVESERAGERVTVAVTDRGPGVPVEQAERVFEPFVRLDAARAREGGAGLGLAIAREIARAHDGDVALDVTWAGPGARFVLWLPAARGA